jgi:hypothetical protein
MWAAVRSDSGAVESDPILDNPSSGCPSSADLGRGGDDDEDEEEEIEEEAISVGVDAAPSPSPAAAAAAPVPSSSTDGGSVGSSLRE